MDHQRSGAAGRPRFRTRRGARACFGSSWRPMAWSRSRRRVAGRGCIYTVLADPNPAAHGAACEAAPGDDDAGRRGVGEGAPLTRYVSYWPGIPDGLAAILRLVGETEPH
jgi:hypothetical protein